MASFNDNTYLDRLGNGNIIMRTEPYGMKQQYSIDQLRMYSRFDFALRADRLSGPGLIIPAGYTEFCESWAQDTECRYQFTQYDQTTGAITVVGIHLTENLLAPTRERITPPLRVHAVGPLPAVPVAPGTRLEPRRQQIVDNLIYNHLERDQRTQDLIRARRERKTNEGPAMASTGPYWKHKAVKDHAKRPRTTKVGDAHGGKGKARAQAGPSKRASKTSVAGHIDMDVDGPMTSTPVASASAAPAAAAAAIKGPKKTAAGDDDELIEYHTDDETTQ